MAGVCAWVSGWVSVLDILASALCSLGGVKNSHVPVLWNVCSQTRLHRTAV